MGADGGLEFFKLKDPSKYNRLIELVEPFHITYHQKESEASRISRDTCWNYLQDNPEYNSLEYLIGMYGTDLIYSMDFREFQSIIYNIQNFDKNDWKWNWIGINPKINTFRDLYLEKETRPKTEYSSTVDYILNALEYEKGINEDLIMDMTLEQ